MNRNENILCCFFEVSLHEILDLFDSPSLFPRGSTIIPIDTTDLWNVFIGITERKMLERKCFVKIFLKQWTRLLAVKNVNPYDRHKQQDRLIPVASIEINFIVKCSEQE